MPRQLSEGDSFPLTKGRYGMGISWDHTPGNVVDVDLQAVIVDNKGQVIDAVYYNNLKAMKCITHSGDETTGEKTGQDECIWVGFGKMPEHVKIIIFVVAAFRGGHLRDALNGKITVLEESKENEVAQFLMERSEEEVDVIATMVRADGNNWVLNIVNVDAQDGQHFIDILEPTIGGIVRGLIPGAPKRLKVAFAMDKGAVVDLPQTSAVKKISAGLGWDTGKGNVDLDVSAVLFDSSGREREAVFFGNLEACGLKHSGDNLTGEGSGDDETIIVDLEAVPEWTAQIMFCVNIYEKKVSFSQVANPYCRIIDSSGSELARYELREAGDQSGLIIARLFREDSGVRWGFQAIGTFCRGNTWKDSMPDLKAVFHKKPRELQMRGASTMSLLGGGAEPQPAPVAPSAASSAAPPPQKSSACALL
mmetsp:Transcript_130832/g.279902  ORF Transcript_130832/g.279902 Transcript_130832/m.279902 type:complete len:421 (+) Transcript_130832:82-1344(+)